VVEELRFITLWPAFLALIAGILILIVPRILNYIVAIYLILVGLIGIFGRCCSFGYRTKHLHSVLARHG